MLKKQGFELLSLFFYLVGIQGKIETVFLFLQAFVRKRKVAVQFINGLLKLTGIDRYTLHMTLEISPMMFVCAHKGFSAL